VLFAIVEGSVEPSDDVGPSADLVDDADNETVPEAASRQWFHRVPSPVI
jgi:hypothetical protein